MEMQTKGLADQYHDMKKSLLSKVLEHERNYEALKRSFCFAPLIDRLDVGD